MRASRLLWPALLAAANAVSATARADASASPLVRLLDSHARKHALADRTGRIPVSVALPLGADARAFGLLPIAPGFGAIRLFPGDIDAFAAEHPGLSLRVGPPRWPLLDVSQVWTNLNVYRHETGGTGKGVVVGVIDTGLDIAHPDFRNADGTTRVAWMLVGGVPQGKHPDLEAAFGCTDPKQSACAIYSAKDIDEMLAAGGARLHDGEGHGTHVTSIAAGNGGPMADGSPRYVGMAPEATLVVAAPSAPGAGFYDPDLVNSARFIFDRAAALAMPAVINLSIGGDFGPHDGTSVLEAGLASLVGGDAPGRAIVVAAGNSGALYVVGEGGPYGIHTEAHVSPHAETRIPIVTPESKDGQAFVWITFRSGDDVSVGLEGPGGDRWIALTDPGEENGYEGDDKTTGAVINGLVNGKTPITSDTNSAVVAWDGAWPKGEFAIVLRGRGDASLWVVGQGDVSPEHAGGLLFERALKQGTINVPASSPGLLAVGCTLNRLTWKPLSGPVLELASIGADDDPLPDGTCYFSSAGPTPFGVPKPEISAPGGFIAAAMSADADPRQGRGGIFDPPGCPDAKPCYLVDDRHAITSGTSMSSPQVAGGVALLLQRAPTLTQPQLTAILQAGARYPKGRVPYEVQLGPGELDVEGALRVLEEDGRALEPEPKESWYVLSSTYARPDPSWPVWGTIELRRADGSVATGLDDATVAGALALDVQGGEIVTPPTRASGGLWRFAVAGARGSGGGTMTIAVRYGGASICASPGETDCGPRSLPIGVDAWAATGGVEGTGGGCTCGQAGRAPGSSQAGLAALGLAALAFARTRAPGRRSRSLEVQPSRATILRRG